MTYYAIIGFSITSLVMFIPNFSNAFETVVGVIMGVVSAVIIYLITRLEDYTNRNREKISTVDKKEGQKE